MILKRKKSIVGICVIPAPTLSELSSTYYLQLQLGCFTLLFSVFYYFYKQITEMEIKHSCRAHS